MNLLKFKITLAYDGTAYHGWQAQKSGRGVANTVEAALKRLFPSGPSLVSSSRTDTGVHAVGLVAHFEVPEEEFRMPVRQLVLAINSGLPDDVRVTRAIAAPSGFHARFDTIGKQYRYTVWNHAAMNPLHRAHAWHVPQPLDLAAMQAAAEPFLGRHDFRSFTAHRDGELGDPVRSLTRCEVRRSGRKVTFVIEGSGFLYKMCRGIVGTLVEVGLGRLAAESIPAILEQKNRRAAGVNAPAHGLVLWKVRYERRTKP